MEKRTRTTLWLLLLYFQTCALQWPSMANTPDNNVDGRASTVEGCKVVDGDICVTDNEWKHLNWGAISSPLPSTDSHAPRAKRAVVNMEFLKWNNGVVPYILAPGLSSEALSAIRAAMDQFMLDTCISFVAKQPFNFDYLYFYSGSGCFSSVGRRGGKQNISIGPSCTTKGVVMHEIFHALGRWHEQSRPDRDQYVSINSQNIKSDFVNNFRLIDESTGTTNNIPYDFDSIMHYDAYAFSRNNEPTIEPLSDTVSLGRLGQRSQLSQYDLDHVRELYCRGLSPASQWSTWSLWSECSSTCGEGKQTRTRSCVGGEDCLGSDSESRPCHKDPCPLVPHWGPWTPWSGCSQSCDGGKRFRLRSCTVSDNSCEGNNMEYESCNTKKCPSNWSEWSGWSECSKSCEGGVRHRSRTCLPGAICTGMKLEEEPCNVNLTCEVWSVCSRLCGGGTQWRLNNKGERINRSCNEEPCHNETCLQGVKHIGCYRLPIYNLKVYEMMTEELSDNAGTRTEPIRKCGSASLSQDHTYFSLADGMCFSGSNQIADYTVDGESTSCSEGRGNFLEGEFVSDVYQIDDVIAFQDSSRACVACGKDYCSQSSLQYDWREMCSISGGQRLLSTLSTTIISLSLLLVLVY